MLRFIFGTLPLVFFNTLRLLLFVVCLFPGFIRFAWYYFIASDRVSVPYDSESVRQTVDVYRSCIQTDSQIGELPRLPKEQHCSLAPVIIFCTGGGWIIGYKMWGALLARALTIAGFVVVIPDMRNCPFVTVPRMVDDVDSAIGWTIKNIEQYGGDTKNIVLVGQSAGGHLACMAIFRKIQRKIAGKTVIDGRIELTASEKQRELQQMTEDEGWSSSDLRGFSAISSPLNIGAAINESFKRIGFDDKALHRMFGYEKERYDPFLTLQNLRSEIEKKQFVKELPPISIYQGTEDKTVPYEVSQTFHQELRQLTATQGHVLFVHYNGWSHTDPILEGPMDADQRLHKDLFDDINRWTDSPNLVWPDHPRVNDRLCPHFLVKLGRILNPF